MAEETRQSLSRDGEELVEAACVYAACAAQDASQRSQHRNNALNLVQRAIQAGYRRHWRLRTDPDLAVLRQDPSWPALLARATPR